ncbi:MAG: hypothetical protein M3251_04790 [Thermoproteota archaeon]|nr:hypothetical protein [Thermoproteota archaeon]
MIQPAILKKNKVQFRAMNNERIEESLGWSPWLDFNKDNIANIAESEGVYKIHAGMKILFIGSSQNLRESMLGCLSDPCISQAKRFSYAIIESADRVKEQLLDEYRNKHKGKLPTCMEKAS